MKQYNLFGGIDILSFELKQIYHPYWLWEDWKLGFYNSFSTEEKKQKQPKVIEMFCNEKETEYYMRKVVKEWKYSCEQNLTNTQMNRIAWLGQGACLLHSKSPSELTMETWKYIPEENQKIANSIAEKIINNYVKSLFK